MAKARNPKIEITEVEVEKVDNRIPLESILEQLAQKAGSQARSLSARAEDKARTGRIKELSTELAKELRALEESRPKPKAAPKRRKRG